jgi:hypothetical protein
MKQPILFFSLLLAFLFGKIVAQNLQYITRTYNENIRTVKLYRGSDSRAPAIIFMGEGEGLNLEFDELVADPGDPFTDYFVDFESCDANWQPSGILPIEFYEGFSQQRITNFSYSEQTKVPYIHYMHRFPMEEERFKMSGNYLLKVLKDPGGDEEVILTHRFIVIERAVNVEVLAMLDNLAVRQSVSDIRFRITPSPNLNMINPSRDLRIAVLENFRWDNGVYGVQPTFFRRDQLDYILNLNQGFDNSPEFRFMDLRSMRLYGSNVGDITETELYWIVTRKLDNPRLTSRQTGQVDQNGFYFQQRLDWPNPSIQADYVKVKFNLAAQRKVKGEVFVLGALNNWFPSPEFKLSYNKEKAFYEGEFLLKQGVYDFAYAVQDPKTSLMETGTFDGETVVSENFYTVLVYFRAPTDRNDRIIGYMAFNY